MSSATAVAIFNTQHELQHAFYTTMRARLESLGLDLTFNEMRVLLHTGDRAGLTQKELVEHSHTDKAQMARLLASLQHKGLLHRTASKSDRRIRCLHLSEQGEQLFVQLKSVQEQVAEKLLQDIPPALQQQLLTLLQQVHNNLSQGR